MHKVKNTLANILVLTAGVAAIGLGLTMAAAGVAVGALIVLAFRLKGSVQDHAQDITPPMADEATAA